VKLQSLPGDCAPDATFNPAHMIRFFHSEKVIKTWRCGMKQAEFIESAGDRPQAALVADTFQEIDWHLLDVSARHYERCWQIGRKLQEGDRWIAITLYLLLISILCLSL